MIEDGGVVSYVQVPKYKNVSRSRYNNMNYQEQKELEDKIRNGGTKNEYRINNTDDTYFIITKTEYNYITKTLCKN